MLPSSHPALAVPAASPTVIPPVNELLPELFSSSSPPVVLAFHAKEGDGFGRRWLG